MQSSLLTPDMSRDPQPGDAFFLFLPIFLGVGIGAYFLLSFEPSWVLGTAFLAGLVLVTALTYKLRNQLWWRWVMIGAVMMALGFVLAQARTHYLNTTLLSERVWSATITGEVADFERVGSGWRVLLKNVKLNDKIYTLRLSMRQRNIQPVLGAKMLIKASLMPPSPPFVPGAYDFQQHAYFQGIGGYGYTTKIISMDLPQKKQENNFLQDYREWLANHVYDELKQPTAGVTTALLNGQRGGIDKATTTAMQESGLQHIISISGLHVGLMAGVIFYLTRLIMALSMRVALTLPIKKIAAFIALVGIIAYMFIVGLSPPTVRSVIMTGIVLFAVMVDREAISLRLVALAALLILFWHPESLLDIGFQLSFAAVTGLVAFYQETRNFWLHARWQNNILMKGLRIVGLSMMTTIIATLTTAPLVLLHFQKIPILSMLANLLATPVAAFLVMPGTFFAYLFAPFPILGDLAIQYMGFGVKLLIDIAHLVAQMPSAVWRAPSLPQSSVLLLMLGGLLMVTLKGKIRWSGMIPVMAAIIPLFFNPTPDMYLTRDRVALWPSTSDQKLYAEGRMDGFQKNILLQLSNKSEIAPWPCDKDVCDYNVNDQKIRLIRTVPALKSACNEKTDLIVTRYYLDRPCRDGQLVDRHVLDEKGGTAIWINKDKVILAFDTPDGAKRPWHQQRVEKGWYSKFKRSNITSYTTRGRHNDRQSKR